MKKTNVSSEVLILLKNLENVSPRVDEFWAQKNGPQNGSKSSPKLAPFLDPCLVQYWGRFWRLLGAIWAPRLARERSESQVELREAKKTTFKKVVFA